MKTKHNMKKIITLLTLLILFSGCAATQAQKQPLDPTPENFIKILNTTKDGQDFIKINPNLQVQNITLIKPDQFGKLHNETRFKLLYENLPQKELYQMDFIGKGTLQLRATIDLESENVTSLVGLFVMGMG
jgi:PBP1b-binding outer membrane lipoprotein LpoB